MKTDTFFCPRCRAEIKRSMFARVFAEGKPARVEESVGPSVNCPKCDGPIPTRGMVRGEYDTKFPAGEPPGCLLWFGGTIAVIALLHNQFPRLGPVWAIGIANIVTLVFLGATVGLSPRRRWPVRWLAFGVVLWCIFAVCLAARLDDKAAADRTEKTGRGRRQSRLPCRKMPTDQARMVLSAKETDSWRKKTG